MIFLFKSEIPSKALLGFSKNVFVFSVVILVSSTYPIGFLNRIVCDPKTFYWSVIF